MVISGCIEVILSTTSWSSRANLSISTLLFVAPICTSALATPSKLSVTKLSNKSPMAERKLSDILPTIPKSINPIRPSSRTSKFPAWTSAWNLSFRDTVNAQVRNAETSVPSGDSAYSLIPSKSTRGTPFRYSIVRTRTPDASGYGSGATASAIPYSVKKARKLLILATSLRKSSSSSMDSRMSSTIFDNDRYVREGLMNSINLLAISRNPRSASKVESTPGLRTLITTSVPSFSFAL
mmetsp:Transcript_31812/g.53672  ORF Transcript_31812/g.53672 Transcript_31812/m.53672 type:complete len:238 (-) Transcript_31812:733-1446(-)